jgi:hypothetical protein
MQGVRGSNPLTSTFAICLYRICLPDLSALWNSCHRSHTDSGSPGLLSLDSGRTLALRIARGDDSITRFTRK